MVSQWLSAVFSIMCIILTRRSCQYMLSPSHSCSNWRIKENKPFADYRLFFIRAGLPVSNWWKLGKQKCKGSGWTPASVHISHLNPDFPPMNLFRPSSRTFLPKDLMICPLHDICHFNPLLLNRCHPFSPLPSFPFIWTRRAHNYCHPT